jgi:hypothetical protein
LDDRWSNAENGEVIFEVIKAMTKECGLLNCNRDSAQLGVSYLAYSYTFKAIVSSETSSNYEALQPRTPSLQEKKLFK